MRSDAVGGLSVKAYKIRALQNGYGSIGKVAGSFLLVVIPITGKRSLKIGQRWLIFCLSDEKSLFEFVAILGFLGCVIRNCCSRCHTNYDKEKVFPKYLDVSFEFHKLRISNYSNF